MSAEIIAKWQGIVDLMAKTLSVPAALITRADLPAIEIFVASSSPENPYHTGGRVITESKFKMYCQIVMAGRQPLYIPDARQHKDWRQWEWSPDVGLGMFCYLGFPVLWPDGAIFGTICVMDRQDNPDVAKYQDIVRQFCRVVQDDLKLLVISAEREQAMRDLEEARAELERRVEARTSQLHHANAEIATILESITDAFVALDWDWRFTYVNERAAKNMGKTRQELLGQCIWDLFPEEVGGEGYAQAMRAMTERRPVRYEHLVRSIGLWFDNHVYPTAEGVAIYSSDITDRKRAEHVMKRARRSAEAANRAKDQFIAVLSHELRTPLTPVLAAVSEWERRAELPAELRDDMRLLRRNVELEARLIDDLLDSTRLTRGKVELHREVVDVHDCIRRVLDICREGANRKRIDLRVNLQAAEHHAWADSARLQQVFWNLLTNAIKFTPAGGTIRMTSTNEAGRFRVQVVDTGIGIDPDTIPRLFKAFEQGEQTKARRFGGLGLGLTIARSLVALHEGQLNAFSEGKEKGATFTVDLPTVPATPKPAVSPPPVATTVEATHGHILLVEDDPDTMRIMSRLLKRMGYVVGSADSVRAALEMAAREHYDLLISDLGLPDGSGLDVMRQVKVRYGLKGLALSGYGTDDDIRQSREAGFQQLLVKPINAGTLESAVRQMTAHH